MDILAPYTFFYASHLVFPMLRLLTGSLDSLQAELDNKAKLYEDRINTLEREAVEKDARIIDLEMKLKVANEKIDQLESQIEELTSKLEGERVVSANLSRQFESEIESLRSKLATGGSPVPQEMASSVRTAQSDNYLSVLEMEGALRRSKQAEVLLINQNMQMKQKLEELQRQAEKSATAITAMASSVGSVSSESDDGKSEARRRFRPQKVVHFVGNVWRKISVRNRE